MRAINRCFKKMVAIDGFHPVGSYLNIRKMINYLADGMHAVYGNG